MKKEVLEQLEFEKSKREILRQSQTQSTRNSAQKEPESHRYAWELELEQYRKNKRKERYLIVGASLGIIAFVLEILSLFGIKPII